MSAGITKNFFLGFRVNSQSCFSTTCRRNGKYRTIIDSVNNRRPMYDAEDKEEYDRRGPNWARLEQKELYQKNRFKSRILIRLPDYSFVDGRPTPIGGRMRCRLEKQMELAKTIVAYSNEMDQAVEKHAAMVKAVEDERKSIIDSKLKPKGKALISSNNQVEELASKETKNVEAKSKEAGLKETKSEKIAVEDIRKRKETETKT